MPNYLLARVEVTYEVRTATRHARVLASAQALRNGETHSAIGRGQAELDFATTRDGVLPLVVPEALMMIEPTETESKETIDAPSPDALIRIAGEDAQISAAGAAFIALQPGGGDPTMWGQRPPRRTILRGGRRQRRTATGLEAADAKGGGSPRRPLSHCSKRVLVGFFFHYDIGVPPLTARRGPSAAATHARCPARAPSAWLERRDRLSGRLSKNHRPAVQVVGAT